MIGTSQHSCDLVFFIVFNRRQWAMDYITSVLCQELNDLSGCHCSAQYYIHTLTWVLCQELNDLSGCPCSAQYYIHTRTRWFDCQLSGHHKYFCRNHSIFVDENKLSYFSASPHGGCV